MTQPRSLQHIVQSFLSESSSLMAPVNIDPNKINILAERYINELDDALAKDNTPLLQIVPRSDGVTWKMVLSAMLRESYKRTAEKESKVPKKVAVDGITVAIRGAETARKQLIQSIDGNKTNPQRSAMLRERIFASRAVVGTKAAWEAELRSEIAAINALGDEAPPGVVDMLDVLNAALRTLDGAKAAPTGRAAKATVWSPPVIEVAMAINLAIGELISSAASKATPKRNASLLRLSAPKRKDEEKTDAAAEKKSSTPEKKPSAPESKDAAPESKDAAPEKTTPAPDAASTASAPPASAAAETPAVPGPVATGADAPAQAAAPPAACEPATPGAPAEPAATPAATA